MFRGTLASFESGTWTATVRFDGSPTRTAGPFPVSRSLASGEMLAGRRVLVDAGDHGDPADYVVVAAWTAA